MTNPQADMPTSQGQAAPSNAERLVARMAALSPEKQALLASRLNRMQKKSRPRIQPRPDQNQYPLSHAQLRLWFLNQFEPESPYYNISAALRINGSLDVAAFENSLNAILRRHSVLRSRFTIRAGLPVQIIDPDLRLALPVTDLSGLSPDEQESAFRAEASLDLGLPFDLERGPLLRARLLRLDPGRPCQRHILLLTIHHIVFDGWSTRVLIRELSSLYPAFRSGWSGQAEPMPEPPLQYADYAHWQNECLREDALQALMNYWEGQLNPPPPPLELPTDRPHPPVLSHNGAHFSFEIPTNIYQSLAVLSRSNDATLFMTLLASFQIMLYRYTRQADFGIGVPVANRPRTEWEELIGFFVNTLVMRSRLSDEDTFRTVLSQAYKTAVGAFSHQEAPFEMLVDRFQPQRNMSRPPLFQVMFDLQEDSLNSLELADLKIEILDFENGASKFELMLMMAESAHGLRGTFEYNTDLFDAATIQRMAGHLLALFEGIAANPDQPIARLPLLTAGECRTLLKTWNDTALEYADDQTWQAGFEAQVERTPGIPAVVYEEEMLAYHQLNQRANHIAHALARRGIGAESVVGLYCERGLDLVAGVLGILKAGGAYLPLDPSYPDERLSYMVEDAGVNLVLTHDCLNTVGTGWQTQLLSIEEIYQQALSSDDDNPPSRSRPDNLAYVIYTSGSTGKPKGVMISHRSAMHLAAALHQRIYASHPRPQLRISLNAPLSFDASVQQLVYSLTRGHTLCVIPQAIRLDGTALLEYIRKHHIDGFDCVPSQLKLLLAAGLLSDSGWTPSILMPGGEAIDETTWETLSQAQNTEVYNMYGPTECTVDSTIGWVRMTPHKPTIGRPVANARLYILDPQAQSLPVGIPGELYIGGAGVGRGYMNQPELTAQRFIPDPFSGLPGARLYRTGDLVRYLPDGNVEFLGRIDHQVKVRGHRIELGEIEAALKEHTAVQDAVILLREDHPGEQRLVAYFLPNSEAIPSTAELRAHLRQLLPDYMIPHAFVLLESFLLTPNGKVDRKAFPAPDRAHPEAERPLQAPRSRLERLLAEKWRQVLHCEQIGIEDNFFELGGDSIQAAVLANQLQDALGQAISVRMVFTSPTIAELASSLERSFPILGCLDGFPSLPGAPASLPRLAPTDEKPLSFAQQRLWFLDLMEPGSPLYNISGAVRIRGGLNLPALIEAVNKVVARHETLRSRFETVDGKPVLRVEPDLDIHIPVIDLGCMSIAEAEQKALKLAEVQARQPFDLGAAPLLRILIYRLGENDHLAALVLHHIISDGWSMEIFVHEMAAYYRRYVLYDGSPAADPLPPLPVQYSDYAWWQRSWLQGQATAAQAAQSPPDNQIAYWRKQLANLPPVLDVPVDRPRPAELSYRGELYLFTLPPSLSWKLKELSQAEGVTLFATLLTAWQTLLFRYSGQEDIAVGCPVAGRNRSELEDLIGFFVNTLVLRNDFSDEPTFLQALHRAHQAISDAHAHQDIPFEMLVSALQPQRDLSHSPLFQVMFAFQNTPEHAVELPAVELETSALSSGTAKFDLTLSMRDEGGVLKGTLEYSTDLFEAETIECMLLRFEKLLHEICAGPERSVAGLPLLLEGERTAFFEAALAGGSDSASPYPADQTLPRLFQEQVERAPDAIALQYLDDMVTYGELNARANRLAHYLRRLGVGTERLVALYLDDPIQQIVGILGVLKAGGAYLPLSTRVPVQRLEFILQDAGSRFLITKSKQAAQLDSIHPGFLPPAHSALTMVYLDSNEPDINQESQSNPSSFVEPENLAYVIYTSGSTGVPKGVLIEQRSACNLAAAYIQHFNLGSFSRVLGFFDYVFDGSVADIFPALLSGARLCQVGEEQRLPGPELAAMIREQAITHMVMTPSALGSLPRTGMTSLVTVVSAGESCSSDIAVRWIQAYPGLRFFNAYGPTEATVAASWYEVGDLSTMQRMNPAGCAVPIGRPLPNVRIYLLDSHLQPVPPGITGEIYIAGAGVARGYLNRPELDAEHFVLDLFNSMPALQESAAGSHSSSQCLQRMYRTGDLARLRRDGNLEFLGRADQQVKIRGFRIEPGEIESVLLSHPGLQECAVTVHQNAAGARRLVAYLVSAAQPAPDYHELIRHLRSKLPDYMIPAAYIYLEELPRTPSNKIDRKALPEPTADQVSERLSTGGDFQMPRNRQETLMAEAWSQVLGIEQVGVNDNFFELGGDSILAIQLVARVAKAGMNFTPRQLFQYPTIAQLVRVVREIEPLRESEDQNIRGPAPLTPVQEWFFEQQFPEPQHWNQTVLLQVHRRLDLSLLKKTVEHLVTQHQAFGLHFMPGEHGWRQAVGEVQVDELFHYHDLSSLPEVQQRVIIERHSSEYQASLDLLHGPLLRIVYFDLGAHGRGRLLLVAHHLVIDGVSWRILLDDIQAIYNDLHQQNPIPNLPRTTSYLYWAKQLSDAAQSEWMQAELPYWLEISRRRTPQVPVDYPDVTNTEETAGSLSVELTSEETRLLQQMVPEIFGADIQEVLLAALAQAYAEWSGDQELLVDLERHGREADHEDIDLSRTIGWFTSIFPVRFDLHGIEDSGQVLKSIKEQLRSVPQKGRGYGLLRYLHPDLRAELRGLPALQPQISFNYLGQFDQRFFRQETFSLAPENPGPARSPRDHRPHLISLNGGIYESRLRMEWTFSTAIHKQETIAWVAERFLARMRDIIALCQQKQQAEYTPADFQDVDLSEDEIDALLQEIADGSL